MSGTGNGTGSMRGNVRGSGMLAGNRIGGAAEAGHWPGCWCVDEAGVGNERMSVTGRKDHHLQPWSTGWTGMEQEEARRTAGGSAYEEE